MMPFLLTFILSLKAFKTLSFLRIFPPLLPLNHRSHAFQIFTIFKKLPSELAPQSLIFSLLEGIL